MEVLIAILILGLITVPIIGMTVQGIQSLHKSQKHTEAVYFAQGEMEYLMTLPYNQLKKQENINLTDSSNFSIELSVEELCDSNGLLYLELNINWDEAGKTNQVTLNTYLADR